MISKIKSGYGYNCALVLNDTSGLVEYFKKKSLITNHDSANLSPIHSLGTISCWGLNYEGQAHPTYRTKVHDIAVGLNHTCLIRYIETVGAKRLYCFGSNLHGQSNVSKLISDGIDSVCVGETHTCIINKSK